MSGVATGAGTRPDVTLKIAQLQNLCKRDPVGYREDYDAQIRRLRSECSILALSPSANPSPRLVELIQFAAAVSSSSYKGVESDSIADLLIALLLGGSGVDSQHGHHIPPTGIQNTQVETNATNKLSLDLNMNIPLSAISLHKEIRKACVSALILMRNKGAIRPLKLLELFFRIMAAVPDKSLREHLFKHLVNDIQNINKKGKRDEKVNRSVQTFLHRIIVSSSRMSRQQQQQQQPGDDYNYFSSSHRIDEDDRDSAGDIAAKRAVEMVAELYRRNIWNDERTVAIMASAIRSSNATVMCKAIRFFLNIEEKMAEDKAKTEKESWEGVNQIDLHLYSKKTKARQRHAHKQVKKRAKEQTKKEQEEYMEREDVGVEASKKLYPAIELLNDPQGLAESVLKRIRLSGSNTFKFEHKLLMINFVTRVVGNHELILLPLYPLLQRYMGGNQRDVTAILAYTVQACHSYVPPEDIYGILKTIAHNFITERCSGEQMAVGINACRAICARVPSVLSKEDARDATGSTTMDVDAFTRDLSAYAKHRDRSVSIAGKSWMNFIREVYPSLLAGKDRGSVGAALHRAGEKPLRYGEQRIAAGVEGADLLVEYEAKRAAYSKKKHEQGHDNESDVETDDEDIEQNENSLDDFNSMQEGEDHLEFDNVGDESTHESVCEDGDDECHSEIDNHDFTDCIIDDQLDESCSVDKENSDDEMIEASDFNDDVADDESEDDNVAPALVTVEEVDGKIVPGSSNVIDTSTMSREERAKLQQEVSSTRIFTTEDFIKMRKLVEREERLKRDPRAAARIKRLKLKGKDFVELSDEENNSEEEEEDEEEAAIHVRGVVNPSEIMAESKRKRASKIERLEKIVAGREKFEHKRREGGSTNAEKKRKKHFLMTKFSMENRMKRNDKETARQARRNSKKRKFRENKNESKKRRRKF